MKLTLAVAAVAAMVLPASAHLRGSEEGRQLPAASLAGINEGWVYFGPATPASLNHDVRIKCADGGKITAIRICSKSWVHGIYSVECKKTDGTVTTVEHYAAGSATKSVTLPVPLVGTCTLANSFRITTADKGFNGATGYTAKGYDNGAKFSSGVTFSYADKTIMSDTDGYESGFSNLFGTKVTHLNLKQSGSSINLLSLPASKNTVPSGNNGSLQETEFGYCGSKNDKGTLVTGLSIMVGNGKELANNGTGLAALKPYVQGFGIACGVVA